MRVLRCIPLLFAVTGLPLAAWCDELTLELGELDAALQEASSGGDPLDRLLADKIQAALREAGLQLETGRLLSSQRIEERVLDGGCNDTVLREMDFSIALNAGTSFSLTLDALDDPIVVGSDIDASIDASGVVRQRFGIDVFGCSHYAQDTFSFTVSGPIRLTLGVAARLNPQTGPTGITITPQFEVTGELASYDFAVNVEDTIVASLLEDYIRDEINAQMSGERLAAALQDVEDDLHQAILDSWGAPSRTYALPEIGEVQVAQLLEILTSRSAFPIALDYVDANKLQILLALLSEDDALLKEVIASAAACEASSILLADLAVEPLYTRQGDACVGADLTGQGAGDYYSDPQCTAGIDYRPTSYSEFCTEAMDPLRLGNAALYEGMPPYWTLTPGTRFGISIVPVTDNHQPFMTRARYRSVGECQLEMRVYKRAPQATGLAPLLALHGGSWQYRGAAFYGLEAQVSHLTDRGFVVFVPFYRLVGTADGNPECHGVRGEDLLADIDAALDWVMNHGAEYGASSEPVTLMGQSAGGHLAGWLAVNRAAAIERALLLYPPTDLSDVLQQVADGTYTNAAGIGAVEGFLGMPLDSVDPASLVVADNSFPARVAANPAAIPPAFMLHGRADTLVPSRQSVRLCNAYAGLPDSGPARDDGGDPGMGEFRNVFECDDRGSTLHLLAEADHGLDVCIDRLLCPAGGADARTAAADSFATALAWLVPQTDAPAPGTPTSPGGEQSAASANASSGAGPAALALLLMCLAGNRRRARGEARR